MKFTIPSSAFAAALSRAGRLATTRGFSPIYGCVLLRADDKLTVRSNDGDAEATETLAADVSRPGAVAVNHDRLSRWAALVTGDNIEVEVTDSVLTAKSGRSKITISTRSADDFPMFSAEIDGEIEIDAAVFRGLIETVLPAVSDEKTRHYLCGVHLRFRNGMLEATATNSNILIRDGAPCVLPDGDQSEFILGTAQCQQALSLLPADGRITIGFSVQKFTARTEAVSFSSKLIDGTFPDADRVIPQRADNNLSVDAPTLVAAIRRAMSAKRGDANGDLRSLVVVETGDGELFVSTTAGGSDTAASGVDTVECQYDGKPLRWGMGATLTERVLLSVSEDTVDLSIADPGAPVLVTNPARSERIGVIMPMRI